MECSLKARYKDPRGEKKAGIILCTAVVFLTFAVAYALMFVASVLGRYAVMAVNIILMYTAFDARGLDVKMSKVHRSLKIGDVACARKALSPMVSNAEHLDQDDISKVAVKVIIENINDRIVAPLMYAVIGGAPLALVYRAVSVLNAMLDVKEDGHAHLGWASAKLNGILNFIPARITKLATLAAAEILRYDNETKAVEADGIIGAIKVMYASSVISLLFFLLVKFLLTA